MAAYFLSFFYFPAYFLLLEFSFFLRDFFSSISTLIFSSIFASILAALLLAFFLSLATSSFTLLTPIAHYIVLVSVIGVILVLLLNTP